MTKTRLLALLLALSLLLTLAACGGSKEPTVITSADDTASAENVTRYITLNGDSATADGGVSVNGSTITIGAAGVYSVSGKLNDGRIIINTGDEKGKVTLILNGADITCLTDSAIRVERAKKLKLQAAEGTVNTITSGTEADMAANTAESTGAAISSGDDLDLEGTGTLNVYGYLNNGIIGKDDINIEGCTLNIVAAHNALRGADSVDIKGGTISITAGNDGIKSTTLDKPEKGTITVEDGSISITSNGDGIAAATTLTINGGSICVNVSNSDEEIICKGLKGSSIEVNGGTIEVISSGNGMRSSGNLTINGGEISLTAGKDGIKTKSGAETVTLAGGTLRISAAKSVLDVEGNMFCNGGSLLGTGNAKSFKSFVPASTQSWLCASAKGAAGDEISVDGIGSLTTAFAYNMVVCSDASLQSGAECTVIAGASSVTATAK